MGEQDDRYLRMCWFLCCYMNDKFVVSPRLLATINSGTLAVLSKSLLSSIFGGADFLALESDLYHKNQIATLTQKTWLIADKIKGKKDIKYNNTIIYVSFCSPFLMNLVRWKTRTIVLHGQWMFTCMEENGEKHFNYHQNILNLVCSAPPRAPTNCINK